MRQSDEKIVEYDRYLLYQKGETAGHRGVGFLIRKTLKNHILELIGISERLAILNINMPGYKKTWTIIQAYAPTESAPESESNAFYSTMLDIINKYNNNYLIVMGDFNAQVGSRESGEDLILGKYGHGKRSNNGHRVIELLLQNNLTLLNSVYKKKPKAKWTWLSPDGKYANEIDLIITNKPKFFNDINVIQNLNFNTDHRMVRCNLKKFPSQRGRSKMNSKQWTPEHFEKAIDPSFTKTLIEIANSDGNVTDKYNHLNKQLSQTRKAKTNEIKGTKFSAKTIELLEERKALLTDKPKRKENRNRISALSKQIRENIKNDRKTKRMQKLEAEIQKTGGTKKAFKELREHGKEWIPKLKNNRSKQEMNRWKIQKLATDFYRTLYSSNSDEQENVTYKNPPTTYKGVPPILTQEVKKAILSQKLGKAPGPDCITNELMRGTVEEISPVLTGIFNDILTTNTIPEQWSESHIILLHKKGDKDNIGNYRPISLISNVYKIFAKVILERITKVLDENQPIEQAGFRKDFSTIDHIHTIKQVLEKYNEYQKPLYICFIDYSKAFDSLNHKFIWMSLKEQGVDEAYIQIIKSIYKKCKSRIKLETKGDQFPINRGVRQGDPLSPKLFNAVLEYIFRKLDWENYGININGSRLNHLRFADDIVLLEEDPNKLEHLLKTLAEGSRDVGLEMNTNKTKLMTNSSEVNIEVNGNMLEYVKEYTYLGQIISPEDSMSKEINKRIACGWRKYWSLKEIMKNKNIGMHIKKKTFNTCILPCMTYGCETWALTDRQREKLATTQRAMERSMLGIRLSDKIRNTDIRRKTKVIDIIARINHLKWGWTGHMLRSGRDKWSKQVTLWYPREDCRRRGRPKTRWRDDIRLTLGPYWTRVAEDRAQWRELEEAYAKRHAEFRDII
ncbi:hypothetical protein MSG28_014050 [Choristoneura fumiferana]|uniref:Uncharacterized protein n=1 Tax=Choristoneura fumiferana TaxID=7141 RepID=A0ACC0JFV2_CHOFU|nr:hypothetical protein MSG28_014050 [Choristoneura fumiferana]